MLVLSASDIRDLVDMRSAIDCMDRAYRSFSQGEGSVPLRTSLQAKGGVTLVMPSYLEPSSGVKVVSVFPENPSRNLPTIMGLMVLLDGRTGQPLALLEAAYLTALRTGASGGVAARYLARPDASVATLIGAGVQGRTQLLALDQVLRLQEVRVYDTRPEASVSLVESLSGEMSPDIRWKLARDAGSAVEEADVVLCATTSSDPVFPGSRLSPGCHVTGVGSFRPDMRELDAETLRRASRVIVDSREAAMEEAGDLIIAQREGSLEADLVLEEIGELAMGQRPGRQDSREITVFKAVGLGLLDVALASLAYQRAEAEGRGQRVDL